MRRIDDIDAQIMDILQSDARTSNAEIARRVELAPSAVGGRLQRLERDGIVRGYEARLDPKAVGADLLAFIFVRADERPGELATAGRLAEIPEVQEVHHIAGEDCYLVKVRTADPEALGRLLRERLGAIRSVTATRTTVVLETVLESARMPVPLPAAAEVV
jgi:Lrp/AsnC family leucine-responsive transcriptional regulator